MIAVIDSYLIPGCVNRKIPSMGGYLKVTYSVESGRWIGLGLIKGGVERWDGKTAVSADPVRNGNNEVQIVSPHFLDPKGERMGG